MVSIIIFTKYSHLFMEIHTKIAEYCMKLFCFCHRKTPEKPRNAAIFRKRKKFLVLY